MTPDARSVSPPSWLASMNDVVAVGVARRIIPGRASVKGIAYRWQKAKEREGRTMSFMKTTIPDSLNEFLIVFIDMEAPIIMRAMGSAIFARIPMVFINNMGTGISK